MAPGAVKVGVFPIFMFFGRLLEPSGAIWMGPQKKQIELLKDMVNDLDIHQKKNLMAPFKNCAGRLPKSL